MTKKDFIALAKAIRQHNADVAADTAHRFTQAFDENQLETLTQFCQQVNPDFKRGRWLEYIAGSCGPNGGAVK